MKIRFLHSLKCWPLLLMGAVTAFAQATVKQQVVEVPFEFYRNEIIVQVKINGRGPFNMMLDTGTDPSAVDLSTAREIGLKLSSIGGRAEGGGTDVNLAYGTILSAVELGAITAKNLEAAAIDLKKISDRLGRPLHGVLGHSLLKGRVVQIDYANRVVRFHSSSLPKVAQQTNTTKRAVLSFRYRDNILVDDVTVNGKKVVANLDTGSNGGFSLTPAAVVQLGLQDEVDRAKVSTGVGYNGPAENREGTISNITVGGISVDYPTVVFFAKGTGRDNEPWSVNIGNAFLKDFVVTIDYRKKLVTLERN